MQDFEQEFAVIHDFSSLPEASLAMLSQRLGLGMKQAELTWCARNYKESDIKTDALRFIDALACPARTELSKVAIGELLTNEPYVAQTFADAIAKLKAMGKAPEKPITLQDLADLPARYLESIIGKDITEPIGTDGDAASFAAAGMRADISLQSEFGRFDTLLPLPCRLQQHADYADALVLLSPTPDIHDQSLEQALLTILTDAELCDHIHAIGDRSRESIAHAILRVSGGAVLNLARLPESLQSLQATTLCGQGLLIAIPRNHTEALLQKASEAGLVASHFGVVDHAGKLILKNGQDDLLSLDVTYLKSVCFIRSYVLRARSEQYSYADDDTFAPYAKAVYLQASEQELQELEPTCDTLLRTLPPLRTRNAVHTELVQNPYHHAALAAADAYVAAAASGSNPQRIWLQARLRTNASASPTARAEQAFCSLLGLYRASVELGVPVKTEADAASGTADLLVLASAPSDMVIPAVLQESGSVYLLRPLCDAYGLPDWRDLARMIAYLRHEMLACRVLSARALCGMTPMQALQQMTSADSEIEYLPGLESTCNLRCPGAILVVAAGEMQGDLIARATITPVTDRQDAQDEDSDVPQESPIEPSDAPIEPSECPD